MPSSSPLIHGWRIIFMKLPSFIYRSERVGKNGKRFSLYKFRTLKPNFDGQYATEEGYTRFGKFLRKTKLDEVPQLFNILKGDMNIVGVRPELPEFIHLIPKDIRKILLSKKPGLTSLSSIHFVDEELLLQQGTDHDLDYHTKIKPLKILLDVFYIKHRNWLLDVWIIFKTVGIVLRNL